MITKHLSVYLKDYKACRIGDKTCTFFDEFNNSIEIDSQTLYLMFRVMMQDLQRNKQWTNFEDGILWRYPGMDRIPDK